MTINWEVGDLVELTEDYQDIKSGFRFVLKRVKQGANGKLLYWSDRVGATAGYEHRFKLISKGAKSMESGIVRLTKSYMGDPVGTEYQVGSQTKVTAWQIIRPDGATGWVPKTYGEFIDPLGALMGGGEGIPSSPLAKPEPIEPPPRLSLRDNQCQLTDITGGNLPESGIDHIIDLYPTGTFDEEFWEFIPDRDEFYWWNPDFLEALIISHKTQERLCVTGMPGAGKSKGHNQYCAIIGQPFFKINGKEGMEPASFVGSLGPDGEGGWEWHDGTLPMCMKIGAYLCMDEVMKIPAPIQMTMQTVYEIGGDLVLDDKPGTLSEKLVKPHDYFRIDATDNVKGTGDNFAMFSSTQMQDSSSLDRFGMYFDLPYMPEHIERLVFKRKFPELELDVIRKVVQVANNVRNSFKFNDVAVTLSPRGIHAICNNLMQGLPPHIAFNLGYLNKLSADNEIQTVKKFIETSNL